jgi:y4mF family transcriptional regulator
VRAVFAPASATFIHIGTFVPNGVKVLGSDIRQRRIELGLRQSDLAEMAGVSERFVRALEHDKPSVQLDSLTSVLEVLGLEIHLRVRGT